MIYNYSEVLEKYGTDYSLRKVMENEEIYKVSKGLYSDIPNVNYLSIITKKYPYGVICGLSAYYYYGFTEVIPNYIYVCTLPNATRIKNNEIKQVRMIEKLYNLGITSYVYDGVEIKIYNKERLLIDLVRNKNSMGYDLYKEIIVNYRKILDTIDMSLIEEYLGKFDDGDRLYKILLTEVF